MTTTTADTGPQTDIDPYSMETLGDLHHYDGLLRGLGPVVYFKKYGFHAITQYTEIQKALRDWRTYSSESRPFHKPSQFRPKILVFEDPPEHTASKAAFSRVLSPDNLTDAASYFEEEADRFVGALVADGPVEIDGHAEFAAAFVMKAFPDLLGLPEEGREALLRFGDAVFNSSGPDSELQREKFAAAVPAMQWVDANTVREAQTPGGIGSQVYAMADEGLVSEKDANDMVKAIFGAGFDTTISALGSMLRAFADNPEEYRKLRENPDLIPNAWEEIIRYYPPARFAGRLVKKDVEVAGVTIPAGESILLMLLASGRDPLRYTAPDEFHVDRDLSGSHLSFGFGMHTCGGKAIATMEGRAMLKALVKRVWAIEPNGEPETALNYQAFAHSYVPVRLIPA